LPATDPVAHLEKQLLSKKEDELEPGYESRSLLDLEALKPFHGNRYPLDIDDKQSTWIEWIVTDSPGKHMKNEMTSYSIEPKRLKLGSII
jgi:hypothetical protein